MTPGAISFLKDGDQSFTPKGTWFDPLTRIQSIATNELPYPAYTFNPAAYVKPQKRNMQAISADSTGVWVGASKYTSIDGQSIPSRILTYDLNGTYIPSGNVEITNEQEQ